MKPATQAAARIAARASAGAALLSCALGAAAQQAAPHPVEGPSFVPMALALVIVLGLMGGAVWVLRRTGIAPRSGTGPLRVVSQLPLGPRERVVVIEAGDRWWLLGVGPGGITRLGTLPRGEGSTPEAPQPSFGALFEKLRGARR